MARKAKVWWWTARRRWAANIGGRRYVAPGAIGEADEAEAGRWFERARGLVASGSPAGDVAFAGLCEMYLEWDEGRVAADQRDEHAHRSLRSKLTTACNTPVGGVLAGDLAIAAVAPAHAQAMVDRWVRDGQSPGYVRELAASIGGVFAWACRIVDLRPPLLDASPVRGLKLPPAPAKEPRFAGRGEAAAWLRWLRASGKDPGYVRLQRYLIHTGARPSEWTGATWGDVDWRRWQVVRADWKSARKTGRPRRIVVPGRIRRSLRRAFVAAGRDRAARMFLTPRGLPWTATNLATTTARYRGRAIGAGLMLEPDGPDRLTCYRWRHTAASTLLMSGVDMATVAELLGTSATMIQRVYGHILDDHLARAAERLSNRR